MAEATIRGTGELITITAVNSIAEGEVIAINDGRAGYADAAIAAGDPGQIRVSGLARLIKATGIVLLDGDEAWWDHSANAVTYKPVNDRDFYLGTVQGDTTSTQTIVDIALNVRPNWLIDVSRDHFDTVFVGTQGLNTMGIFRRGGGHKFLLSSTNEAQKMDILSTARFSKDANAIIEFVFTVPNDGAGSAPDVSVGVANGTHASDAQSITEALLMHLDGNSTAISLESRDGTSTPVAITDTTLTYTEGAAVANRVHVTMDLRNPAACKVYINKVQALPSSVFNISAAASQLGLLAHIEKTAAADVYEFNLESMRLRISEQ